MPALTLATPDREGLRRELGRRTLKDFIRQSWPLVEPTTPLSWNWHLEEMAQLLESVSRGEVKRVIINIPPGCMKSLMVSVFWPAWEWASDASLRYLTAAYSTDNTIRDNRRLRSIVTSDWYRSAYGLELASDQSAKVRFDTTDRGWRIATSVGGIGTGEHPDRIIIDDPLKAAEARSELERESCKSWFGETVSTRIARDPAIVIIMQRLHEDDLAGHLISKGGWEHLCLPMRFEPDDADPRDHRSEAGELLWPSLWPEDKVAQEERDLGPYGAAGQLQQKPAPEGGGLFKREWFQVVDAAPVEAMRIRGWDTAATENAGDYTAGVLMAEHNGIYYVEDVVRVQSSSVDVLIPQIAESDGKDVGVREEQEPGASGKAVIQSRTKELAGYDYQGVPVTGDKVTRLRPFRAQCEAGNVKLVRGEWNDGYLRELSMFPMGKYDDQADGSSCSFNALALERRAQKVSLTWGRRSRRR